MSTMYTFTSIGFALMSVSVVANGNALVVRFTYDPKQVSSANANDALNPLNWTLTGPQSVVISSCATIDNGVDLQDILLNLAQPLPGGDWVITVANVVTNTGGFALGSPTSLNFNFEAGRAPVALNAGSTNDDAEEIYRKHFNPGFPSFEPGWNALIGAITAGDQIVFDNSRLAINQLFIHSASSIYLDRRAADVGIVRPDSVGISDDVFRRLVIKTTTKKVVTQALLEAMEVFYGTDSTRANLTSGDEPYALQDGWELLISIDDEDPITVPFSTDDFTHITQADAMEVAAVITRWFENNGSTAYALEVVNPETGDSQVKIYSGTLGLDSSVRVTGGRAQNKLLFPTLQTQVQVSQAWAVRNSTSHSGVVDPGKARFLVTGASTTNLNEVIVGDYVNIYGINFNSANRGSFPITKVDVRYVSGTLNQFFEIALDGSVAQASVTQLTTEDMMFFRPTRTTVNDNGARAVVVAQTSPRKVHVQLPATTSAVSRTAKTGAYANTQDAVVISSLIRQASGSTLIGTSTAHGLSVGGQTFLDLITPSAAPASITAGNGTTTSDASLNSFISGLAAPGAGTATQNAEALLLATGQVFSAGGRNITGVPVDNGVQTTARRFGTSTITTLANGSLQYTYAWTASAAMPAGREFHRMSLLTDASQGGNVLLTGGWDGTTPQLNGYLYDTAANSWTSIPMTTARSSHTQTTLNDGRVLVTGGGNTAALTPLASAEIFIPQAAGPGIPGGVWISGGSMSLARTNHAAAKLDNGNVLVIGGRIDATDITQKCELFNPTTGVWSRAGDMSYARHYHSAIKLSNNQVFVWGGFGHAAMLGAAISVGLPTCEMYDGNTGRWYSLPDNLARNAQTLVVDPIAYLPLRNQILLGGGSNGFLDIFDVTSRTWKRSPAAVTTTGSILTTAPLLKYPMVTMDTGNVLLVGGQALASLGTINGGRLYIPASDTIAMGGLNGIMHEVLTVPTSTSFTISTPDYGSYTSNTATDATSTAVAQIAADPAIPGPYIYSPDEGVAITGTNSDTTSVIYAGTQYETLPVTDATDFPDEEGWLVLGFGTSLSLSPVKYLGRADDTTLILDYGTIFPQDLPIGTDVTLLLNKSPFLPDDPVDAGSLYITDSNSGRIAASNTLDSIVAAGIILEKDIVYPGDVGLGAAGYAEQGGKLSDIVEVFAGNDIDNELKNAREDLE